MPSKDKNYSCPMSRDQVIEAYFLEHRGKLLDVAAFLDRVDRSRPSGRASGEDYRVAALREALRLLADGRPRRVERVLKLLSDPTGRPIPKALGKATSGAYGGGNRAVGKGKRVGP
jgi:hypothetical protein